MHWYLHCLRLNKYFLVLILSFIKCHFAFGQTDSQLWTETLINLPAYKTNYVYGAINITRIGREMGTLTDKRFGGYFGYKFYPEFTLVANYISLTRSQQIGSTQDQERALLDATGRIHGGEYLNYTYRMRFERQFRVDQADRWDIRPRIGFELPNSLPYSELTPFANFEGFYDSSSREWYRLRSLIGVNYKYSPEFNFDLYYGNQANRFYDQTDLSIVGLTMRFQIPDEIL